MTIGVQNGTVPPTQLTCTSDCMKNGQTERWAHNSCFSEVRVKEAMRALRVTVAEWLREVTNCEAEQQHARRTSLSHSGAFSDLEVIKVSIPGRNKKETCDGKQPWGSNGSQFTDNAGSSNTKCELSVLNNDVTVNKKCFARCQAEEEVLAEAAEAVMKAEVQVGLHTENKTMSQQMTRMRKWNLHHTMQARDRVQHMIQ